MTSSISFGNRWIVRAGCLVLLLLLLLPLSTSAEPGGYFADIHTHYNWDQREVISPEEVNRKLTEANVAFAVVAGTPSSLALKVREVGGERIQAFFSPYIHAMGRWDWFRTPRVVELAEEGLRQGHYQGIGEVHFMVGFKPRTDNPVFLELLRLAEEYEVPVLLHLDAGNDTPFRKLCLRHPDVRFIFAHAGGNLHPEHIRRIVRACDNVLVEFSARDPWRYGGLTGPEGELLPDWRQLVLDFPDRFATGTDPVWRVTRTSSWDEPDDGWDYFETLLDYHRKWLLNLPPEVETRIRLTNAARFLGMEVPE